MKSKKKKIPSISSGTPHRENKSRCRFPTHKKKRIIGTRGYLWCQPFSTKIFFIWLISLLSVVKFYAVNVYINQCQVFLCWQEGLWRAFYTQPHIMTTTWNYFEIFFRKNDEIVLCTHLVYSRGTQSQWTH